MKAEHDRDNNSAPLLPQHKALIDGSAISPEVAAQRGYRSVTTKAELQRLGFGAAQRQTPTLLIPAWNVGGAIGLYHHRPDEPRAVKGKAHKYEFPAGARMIVDVPPAARAFIGDPRIPLFITEGARKADAAVSIGLCCIAVVGVWNWRGTNGEGGKTALPDWEQIALKGQRDAPRVVYLCFDSDVMVKRPVYGALARLAAFLGSRGARVRYVYLPHGTHGEKVGLDDYLAAGHGREELLSLASTELRSPPDDEDEQPRIAVAGRRMHEITADALKALDQVNAAELFLFSRGTVAVRLTGSGAALAAEPLTPPSLKGELDRRVSFVNGSGAFVRPPADVVQDMLTLSPSPFPPFEGIVSAPLFLDTGALLSTNGYDAASGFYVDLDRLGFVRTDMARADAVALLRDHALGDFPFADEGSSAHALALLLQPFLRPLIAGPTPLYLIDAPARGTGKGLLAEVAALIALGHPAPVMAPTRDEDELEKRITAILLEGSSLVLLDNVTRLDAKPLAAVLTSEEWRGRLLGKSQMLRLQQRATWIATGNNVTLSDELARRVVPIRLDAGVERPELRGGFQHVPLPAWILAERDHLISAALSLVQHWLTAGRPPGSATLGRYESWACVLGGILDLAGVPGFLKNRETLYTQADTEGEEWRAFCAAVVERLDGQPARAAELLPIAKAADLLIGLWAGRSDLAATQRLGRALNDRRDRVFGPYRIRLAGRHGTSRNQTYAIERVTPPPNTRNTRNTHADSESAPAGDAADPGVSGEAAEPNTRSDARNTRPETGNTRADSCPDGGVSGVSGVSEPPAAAEQGNGHTPDGKATDRCEACTARRYGGAVCPRCHMPAPAEVF